MSIRLAPKTQPPADQKQIDEDAAARFIGGAPDAKPVATGQPSVQDVEPVVARKGIRKGRREQISHTILPDRLAAVDTLAAKLGMSRTAVINMAIEQLLERGAVIGGLDRK